MVAEKIGPFEPESEEAKLLLKALNHPVEASVEGKVFRIDLVRDTGLPPVDPEKQLAAIRSLANLLKHSPTFDAEALKLELRQYRDAASEGRFGDE